ncbi:RagB/SusD family nutrient uptake outer membrane protein [Anaerophaga thermohalophila]|uniref:RagB/SusD family nutrient uptake outer membrane protein n=1 Tax=Anaerophaga thermohalophila TaxID=177400 RepID=UPI000237D5B0|nr:RagB/SusD family nutrient uptake outer membrane protein [Anaerophaga thermohalophila]
MKSKIIYVIAILGIVAFSCDLSEEPYGFYSDDNFYKTQADAESALRYAYNALTYIEYTRGITSIGDLPTQTTDLKPDEGVDAQEMNSWTAGSTNETLMNYFKYCYIAINRANAVLHNVSDASFDQEIKNRILGEAYTLRAWSYFNLIRVFGVVPVQREMVQTISQTSPSLEGSLEEVYDFMIGDLRKATEMLEIDRRVGRLDKAAAWSILAKAYLTMASSKENGVLKYSDMTKDVAQMYDSAAFFAEKVLHEQNEYSFDPDLLNIYDVDSPDGPEHIFILSQDRTGQNEGNYSKTPLMFLPWGDGAPYYLMFPDGSLVYTTNGWEVYRVNDSFADTYDDNDLRKTALLHNKIYNDAGEVTGSVVDGKIPSLFCVKYLDPYFVGQKTSAKPYLIRFSDIALTYAEAVGPTSEGYEWLNRIRDRAGLSNAPTGMSLEEFREAVIQERAWEFAYEGQYLYDLRRTKTVLTKVPNAISAGISEEVATFYPIPQREIDLNPNISQ